MMRFWSLGMTPTHSQGFKNHPCTMPHYETADFFEDPDEGLQDKGVCGPTDDPWIITVIDEKGS